MFLAIYNFDGKVCHGLQLSIGDTVHIKEECSGDLNTLLYSYTCLVSIDIKNVWDRDSQTNRHTDWLTDRGQHA